MGVRPSIQNPFLYEEANVRGTLNLLDLSKSAGVENFVLTSSSSVYGNSTRFPFREDDSVVSTAQSHLMRQLKKQLRSWAITYHHLYQLNVNVIRPFTVYGPRGRPDMAPWLFLKAALEGKPIRRFGDGSTRRDYTFVGDFVAGFVAAIDCPLGYEIFNLGNSETVSLSEALDIISRVSGKKLQIIQEPPQAGDVDITFADISKARQKLNYDPKNGSRACMTQFLWLRENQV